MCVHISSDVVRKICVLSFQITANQKWKLVFSFLVFRFKQNIERSRHSTGEHTQKIKKKTRSHTTQHTKKRKTKTQQKEQQPTIEKKKSNSKTKSVLESHQRVAAREAGKITFLEQKKNISLRFEIKYQDFTFSFQDSIYLSMGNNFFFLPAVLHWIRFSVIDDVDDDGVTFIRYSHCVVIFLFLSSNIEM